MTMKDFSKGKPLSTSEEARQKARDFAATFATKEDFWQALKNLGFSWRGEDSVPQIIDMWAHNALAAAIDMGYDPFADKKR